MSSGNEQRVTRLWKLWTQVAKLVLDGRRSARAVTAKLTHGFSVKELPPELVGGRSTRCGACGVVWRWGDYSTPLH